MFYIYDLLTWKLYSSKNLIFKDDYLVYKTNGHHVPCAKIISYLRTPPNLRAKGCHLRVIYATKN